jgi:hypothetical protein
MRAKVWIAAIVFCALTPFAIKADPPSGQPPAGSTGLCKDGTYTKAASKSGACGGHKGVQTWYAAAATTAPAATPAPTPAPAPASTPAAKPSPASPAAPARTSTSSGTSKTPAPGGGPGLVWVNTESKVYHCQGTQFYGTTKAGKYMSEADAKAMGAHADHNTPCTK